ncbi:MAG TPA: PTS sugar transporter subunit IIA [Spirochaetales bacterium]|nr:PTS sugar transporter subunit IIA [Spirochaetales bacterium]
MKLSDFLDRDLVLPDLAARTKNEVLTELVASLGPKLPDLDADKALQVLLEREHLGTTGIGDGVAIPHGKMEDLQEIVLVVGRSKKGVDFEALDFKPCTIFFLVLAPEQVAGTHLRILATISRLLRDESFRRSFQAAADRDELWRLLAAT